MGTLAVTMSKHEHHDQHSHAFDFKAAFSVSTEPGSLVKIVGDIPWAEVEMERKMAIKNLGKDLELPGFRKGYVPENMLVKHLGEMRIVAEMAERAIAHMYGHILDAHQIDAIGQPKVEITKLEPNKPLGILILVAVLPKITLPDVKAIASTVNKEKADILVTEEDVEAQVQDILRRKVAFDRLQAKAKAKADGKTLEEETEETDPEKLPLPPLTDDLVKTLGQPGQFTDSADFKAKIKEHLTIEKAREVESGHRAKLTDAIIEQTAFELPQILIDSELSQMFAHMEEDITRAGLKLDDYLAHVKKTRDDLRKEWTPAAEKRARLQLILNEIAKVEKIVPDSAAVENEVEALLKLHKEADPRRVRVYVESVLTNEAVLKMLESAK